MTRLCSWFFTALALASLAALVGIFVWQSVPVFYHEGLRYLTGSRWFFRQHQCGALAMI
jgi:phosphate transport system permease protein